MGDIHTRVMFCGQCGRPVDSESRFCGSCCSVVPQVSAGLVPSDDGQLEVAPHRGKTIIWALAAIVISFFVLLLVISEVYNTAPKRKTTVTEQGEKEAEKVSPAIQPQKQAGESVENAPDQTSKASGPDSSFQPNGEAYPYEVLRNPYGYHKGFTLLLKVSRVPYVLQDVIQNTADPRSGIGFVAIQFERSLSATMALFAIKGMNLDLPPTHPSIDSQAQGLWQFGEMVVDLGTDGDVSELDVTKNWIVLTEGATRGTNKLGGPIEVPGFNSLSMQPPKPTK